MKSSRHLCEKKRITTCLPPNASRERFVKLAKLVGKQEPARTIVERFQVYQLCLGEESSPGAHLIVGTFPTGGGHVEDSLAVHTA